MDNGHGIVCGLVGCYICGRSKVTAPEASMIYDVMREVNCKGYCDQCTKICLFNPAPECDALPHYFEPSPVRTTC